ncbi:serine/threonine-protein kinase [Nannocystis pusilla]|uniref:Serine/threonine protein kinase n=1 Tax=Nannocystis pusilla TaxID=889268 RepID=A0ABS7TYU3_9BACT|nr:serine/threonine-protein kinase [Nannocystis pusilla]MBZ5713445.1 serine/threonine protein kinase [Nannocystis pusilla]
MPLRPSGSRRSVSGRTHGMWPEAPDPLLGHTLADRYRLEKVIGHGGMGTVYRAEHVVIRKPVAVKVLDAAHSERRVEVQRFLNEARAASKIRHEHVVDITDFGSTDDGLVFLVMEYLEGEDLAATSDREGSLPWRRAAAIVLQIAAALEAAHAQGIIHRDMKPENCFRIRRGNDPDFIKVLDFGIAKVLEDSEVERPSSAGSGLLGTPEYLAPELIRGLKPDARVDIYAVGVMLYDLLVGKLPFAGESFMSTLTAHLMELPTPPSQARPAAEIPAALDAVVLRALAKDRDLRYDTIGEFAAALRAAIAEADVVVAPPPTPPPLPPPLPEPPRTSPRWIAAGVVALLVLFSAVLWTMAKRFYTTGQVAPAPAAATVVAPIAAAAPVLAAPVAATKVEAPVEVAKVEVAKAEAPPVAAPPVAAPPVEPPPVEPPTDEAPADEAPEPATVRGPATPKGPRNGPAPLTADEFAAGMAKLGARVKLECSRYALRKMAVTVQVVVGADGSVKSAEPTGSQAGSTLGNCVARVAKTALLRPSRAKSSHRHTFTM